MAWLQVQFSTDSEQQQALEDALFTAGAVSVTYADAEDQAILEPGLHETPLWDALLLTALFDADSDSQLLLDAAEQAYGQPLPRYELELLQDRDWEREWMDDFEPIQFGDKLWICPSWHQPVDANAVNIRLDPGLAFGTGTHPTTAMCLRALNGLDVQRRSLLDVGCGSGVLAIAGLLLGADTAVGTDIDPQAITASRENAERNGIEPARFALYLVGEEPIEQRYDIVIANILAGPLVEMAAQLSARLKPGCILLLSGLLSEQQGEILDAYTEIAFEHFYHEAQWLCLQGVKISK